MMKLLKRLAPVLIVMVALSLSACGGSADAPVADKADTATPTAKAPVATQNKISGGRRAAYENCTFTLPGDWQGDEDTGIWCPGNQNLDMGRPGVSLHCGGIPVMTGSTVEDRLKFYYGAVPATVKKFKKCGMNARYVDVTARGYRHLGLILEEKTGPMMVLNFFDCQAPEGEFNRYQSIFKGILNSVQCK